MAWFNYIKLSLRLLLFFHRKEKLLQAHSLNISFSLWIRNVSQEAGDQLSDRVSLSKFKAVGSIRGVGGW